MDLFKALITFIVTVGSPVKPKGLPRATTICPTFTTAISVGGSASLYVHLKLQLNLTVIALPYHLF